MTELKPCPFCGRKPTYWKWNYGAMVECHQEDHRVQCEAKTMDEAVEAWNQRACDACGMIAINVKMPENCHECGALGINDIVGLECDEYSFTDRPDGCPLIEIKEGDADV